MDNDSVKYNIRNFRKSHRLTQSEMAERLGISRTAYRNIEAGETKLINDTVGKIAGILEIDTAELVLGYPPQKTAGRNQEKEIERMSLEIARLENEIANLRKHLETQEELIRTKDEIIGMLKKHR